MVFSALHYVLKVFLVVLFICICIFQLLIIFHHSTAIISPFRMIYKPDSIMNETNLFIFNNQMLSLKSDFLTNHTIY